ncbi:MAG TPA: hypothetical protein VFF40_14215 [Acidimicrobiia bacterium]|nr:hypothetical protein [Acidimicrobiia bacterium]
MGENRWATRVARDLIVTARVPGENDGVVVRRLIGETVDVLTELEDRAEQERLELEELVELVMARLEHEGEIARQQIAAAEAMLAAEKVRRRLERRARNAETRARRVMQEAGREGMISRHVLVDLGAWQLLGREARRQRTTLMSLAGQVLAVEVAAIEAGGVVGSPSTRRRRSPGEGEPRPTDRVVRLLLAPGAWDAIVGAAGTADTSAGRYAGEALELAAHANGWRAAGPLAVR